MTVVLYCFSEDTILYHPLHFYLVEEQLARCEVTLEAEPVSLIDYFILITYLE